jgi:hypothetical protein
VHIVPVILSLAIPKAGNPAYVYGSISLGWLLIKDHPHAGQTVRIVLTEMF